MAKFLFNPDVNDFIHKYEELGTWKKLATHYGVSGHTIRVFAKKAGIKSNRRYEFSKEEIDYIITSRRNGKTLQSLANEFGCSRTVITNICNKDCFRDRYLGRRYMLNENKFSIIDNEAAYFLGFIASDGCLYHKNSGKDILRICIQQQDEYILQKFAKFLETTIPLHYTSRMNNYKMCNYVSIEIASDKIVSDIMNLGIGFRKTYGNCIPDIPLKFMPHFIRGYFDGDGSVYGKDSLNSFQISIAGFSKNMLKLIDILGNFNILTTFTIDKRKGYNDDDFGHLVSTNKLQIYSFLKFIYNDCGELYLQRKFDIANKYIQDIENSDDIRNKQIVIYYNNAVYTKVVDMCK